MLSDTERLQQTARLRLLLARFEKARDGAEFLVVTISPTAYAAQRDDECPAQFGEGILDGNGLRSRHLSGD